MIPIIIDTSDLIAQFSNINEKDLSATILAATLAELNRGIVDKANKELNSSKDEYLRNIKTEIAASHYGWVELTGAFPNSVEKGMNAFDMKAGMLRSSKAKIAEDGSKYIDVPFKHGTPGSNVNKFASVMPQDVYDVAKNLGTKERLDINEVGNPHNIPSSRAAIKDGAGSTLYREYNHKFAIHDGMKREQMAGQNRGKYTTFRRISEKSDPLSWIHMGIKARNIFSKVEAAFDPTFVVDRAIDNYLKGLGL
jgi:hypothetical protein